MNSNKRFFTRKQEWRRCNHRKQPDLIVEGIPVITKNNNTIPEKRLRFKNIVHVTLIPTRKELDELYKFYNSYLEFEKD